MFYGVVGGADGSATLVGYTEGAWNRTNHGNLDFAGAKLDSEGAEVWRWQVSGRYPRPPFL